MTRETSRTRKPRAGNNEEQLREPASAPANTIPATSDSLSLPFLERILSGGQTGVDRAALDVAIELGIEHGGWCPKGRLAEDGRIDDRYRLIELESRNYVDRTRRNVMDADGTLILYTGILQGGTFLTARFAEQLQKPLLTIRLSHPGKPNRVRDWVLKHHIKVMNIAGPRATKDPTIYKLAVEFLNQTLRTVR